MIVLETQTSNVKRAPFISTLAVSITACNVIFFLHEVCANLPRKLDHAFHHHPLFLDPVPQIKYSSLQCSVYSRSFNGFRYKCFERSCRDFQVDFGCILVPDFFIHKSHEHPLFIPIYASYNVKIWCKGCRVSCGRYYLQCTLCQFAICYKCATFPNKLHYKHAALPLSLCYGEASDETY